MKTNTPEFIKKNLYESINQLLNNKEKYCSNPDKDFTRTQKISFADSIIFPMVASSDSTSVEMLEYFSLENLPSQAAMSYRRDQISLSAFQDLLTSFTSKISQNKTFKGMRIIACDGTRVNTPYNPKDTASFVNRIKDKKGFNQYHLNTCYDVLNNLYLDAVIQDYFSMNENLAFCEMIDRFPQNESVLFTADRGYSSYNVIAHILNRGHHFVLRLTKTMAQGIFRDNENIPNSDTFDIEDDFNLGRVRKGNLKSLRNFHHINKNTKYDFIDINSTEINTFHARLLKFILPSGEAEYLLTDLSNSDYSLDEIKEIYHIRWNIETSYRYLKYASGMVHIHSLKQKFIFQEIYAKLICYNFCIAVKNCVKNPEKPNKKNKVYAVDMSYLIKSCIRFIKGLLDDIIPLITKKKVPVREGRKFQRNKRTQHADTLQYR